MTEPATRPRITKRWRPFAFGIAVVAVVVAVDLGTRPDGDDRLASVADRQAPTFAVPDLRDPDRTIELADYRGGPVVLNFWASWCMPCRREMPALQATHEELGDAVTFIGMNHQDDRDAAMDLLAEVGVTYSSGFDPEGKVAAGYGLFGMPTTVFISPDGAVVAQHTGELSAAELEQAIDEHLGQP